MWGLQHSTRAIPPVPSSMDAVHILSHLNKLGTYGSNPTLDQLLDALDEDQETPPPHWQKTALPEGEVFITPAPYLDHEYCHCQKHIRRPAETSVIESVNSRLRQEKLHLLRELVDSQTGLRFNNNSLVLDDVDSDLGQSNDSSGEVEEDDRSGDSSSCHLRQVKRCTKQVKEGFRSRKRRAKGVEVCASLPKVSISKY